MSASYVPTSKNVQSGAYKKKDTEYGAVYQKKIAEQFVDKETLL